MIWCHTHSFRLFPVSFQLRSSLARIAEGGDPPAEFYSLTRQRGLGFFRGKNQLLRSIMIGALHWLPVDFAQVVDVPGALPADAGLLQLLFAPSLAITEEPDSTDA